MLTLLKRYHNIGVKQHMIEDYKSAIQSYQHALQIRLKLNLKLSLRRIVVKPVPLLTSCSLKTDS